MSSLSPSRSISATPFPMSSPPRSSTVASSPPPEETADSDEEFLPEAKVAEPAPKQERPAEDAAARYAKLKFLLNKSSHYTNVVSDIMKRSREKYSSIAAQPAPAKRGGARSRGRGRGRGTRTTGKRARVESEEEDEDVQALKRAKVAEPSEKPAFIQPALLTGGTLKDYQLEGVAWMVSLWENGISGILADEMGLGKTIQTIGFIAYLRVRVEAPFLIVCPLSVLHNWVDEFTRFAPDIPVCMYHGAPAERAELRRTVMAKQKKKESEPSRNPPPAVDEVEEVNSTKQASTFPVVITTYEMIIKDRVHLAQYDWGYVVVDEGHRLKNIDSILMREIQKYPSAGRMILTGTPLHNNLSELWSLLHFILPDIFDDLDSFNDWFDLPSLSADIGANDGATVLHTLHEILKPFLLRRLKVDVERELPPKKEYVLYAPLSERQREVYDAIVKGGIRGLLAGAKPEASEQEKKRAEEEKAEKEADSQTGGKRRLRRRTVTRKYDVDEDDDDYFNRLESGGAQGRRERGDKDSGKTAQELGVEHAYKAKLKKINNMHLQNAVMQLRKVCSHPFLFDWPIDPDTHQPVVNEELVGASGKMMVLERLLDELFRRGHKVLVFSQFKTMLDVIDDWATEFKHWPLCRIDGGTPAVDRRAEMNRFQTAGDAPDAPRLFLLSTRAGGLGITLTAADTVVFYDQDWNPQMDLQAQDRAHRIGQTKPVLVFRLVSKHTIESKIMQRATEKRKLEALVIAKGKFKMPAGGSKAGKQETMAEMAASLLALEGEKIEVVSNTEAGKKSVISDADLDLLLDRRKEVFEARGMGWTSMSAAAGEESLPKKGAKKSAKVGGHRPGAFEVYVAPPDEGNDALGRMMGDEGEIAD